MEEDKLDIDKLREEIRNATVNANENTISTYGTVDVDKLLKTVEHFRKVPTVEELINENNKLLNRLEQDERVINKAIEYIERNARQCGNGEEWFESSYCCTSLLNILKENQKEV